MGLVVHVLGILIVFILFFIHPWLCYGIVDKWKKKSNAWTICVCLFIIIEVQTAPRFNHIHRNEVNCKNDFVLIIKELFSFSEYTSTIQLCGSRSRYKFFLEWILIFHCIMVVDFRLTGEFIGNRFRGSYNKIKFIRMENLKFTTSLIIWFSKRSHKKIPFTYFSTSK